jgi:hypothetical protein
MGAIRKQSLAVRQLVELELAVASKRQAADFPNPTDSGRLSITGQRVALVTRDVAPPLLTLGAVVVVQTGRDDKQNRDIGLNGHLAATR